LKDISENDLNSEEEPNSFTRAITFSLMIRASSGPTPATCWPCAKALFWVMTVTTKTIEAFKKNGFKVIKVKDLLQKFENDELDPKTMKDTLILMPSAELSTGTWWFPLYEYAFAKG
jgi:hypothetical protein